MVRSIDQKNRKKENGVTASIEYWAAALMPVLIYVHQWYGNSATLSRFIRLSFRKLSRALRTNSKKFRVFCVDIKSNHSLIFDIAGIWCWWLRMRIYNFFLIVRKWLEETVQNSTGNFDRDVADMDVWQSVRLRFFLTDNATTIRQLIHFRQIIFKSFTPFSCLSNFIPRFLYLNVSSIVDFYTRDGP